MGEYKRICNFCNKDFIAQKRTTKFCSHKCNSRGYKLRKRLEQDEMFTENETVKMMLIKIIISIEGIEKALDLYGVKEQVSNDELLTPQKFCELMNIHRKTLTRMIQREEVEVTKIGSKIFINKNQLIINK
ncbi:helix-turn-helix domain-containing protein [Epilithonimonas sp.]|uniref:helix-turn-helix domain-containing protein n=1 Tax=Epilithonimonas sp. TaxID=2894511 RepID=UPI0035B203F1